MKKIDTFKKYYNELKCILLITGHSLQGESIIFIVYGDSDIIYSCVVDSFKVSDDIVPLSQLEKLKIDHVTDVFWTHPHDDHSVGIVDLINKFKPEHVYIPCELQTLGPNNNTVSNEILNQINAYNSYDRRYDYQPKICGVTTNLPLYHNTLLVGANKIPFDMFAVAPCNGRVRKKVVSDNYSMLNDFSLVLSINIGDFSILLTGDIQDSMISHAYQELCFEVPTPNILKIPHHGSNDSLSIIDLFENTERINAAVTTAKRSSKLPTEKAIRYYSDYCDNVYQIDKGANKLAIWGAEIDVVNAKIKNFVLENY